MAKFFKTETHEDTTTKHEITCQDIGFLVELQKRLNTQDHLATADPRYWVIRDYKETISDDEHADHRILCNADGDEVARSLQEACDYIKNDIMARQNMEGRITDIRLQAECPTINLTTLHVEYRQGNDTETRTLWYMHEVADFLNEYEDLIGTHECICTQEHAIVHEGTLFLTQDAADAHLAANAHNYGSEAHAYCMCAHRSPELEQLLQILQTVDWKDIENAIHLREALSDD